MDRNRQPLYPLLFKPVLKDYIWGGRNLAHLLSRDFPDSCIAESWEIAAHEDGVTVVTNGAYAGLPLTAVHERLGLELIGSNNFWAQERDKFPLLVKLLDAQDKLSIQVHPGDDYAQTHEGNELGKTEMWVVLHAQPGAAIIMGVRPHTTPEMFREAIGNGSLEDLLYVLPVRDGDVVCVPSGTIHAILGGVLIVEIQQNSNATYRVYDWDRRQNGKPRPLHIDKALDVIDFSAVEPRLVAPRLITYEAGVSRFLLCRNRYFTTERVEFDDGAEFSGCLSGETLEIWGALDGQIEVNGVQLEAVQFTLLPAALGPYRVTAQGKASCLRTYVENTDTAGDGLSG